MQKLVLTTVSLTSKFEVSGFTHSTDAMVSQNLTGSPDSDHVH